MLLKQMIDVIQQNLRMLNLLIVVVLFSKNNQQKQLKLFDFFFKVLVIVSSFQSKIFFSINRFLVSHMSIPKFSIANRLTEQAAEYKRRNDPMARVARRTSVPFDSVDSGLYRQDSQEDDLNNDLNDYGNELQLRVDSFDDRNVKL
jgi:hypothetical protein